MYGSVAVKVNGEFLECPVYAVDEGSIKLYMDTMRASADVQAKLLTEWDTYTGLSKTTKVPETHTDGDVWRRLDVSRLGKFSTNLQNVVFAAKIATPIRYMFERAVIVDESTGTPLYMLTENTEQVSSDGNQCYMLQENAKDYNNLQKGEIYAMYRTCFSTVTELYIFTTEMRLQIKEIDGDVDDYYSYFQKLTFKNGKRGGNTITKVRTGMAKYQMEYLGFEYEPQAQNYFVDDYLLYDDIDEVIAAHPQKNYRWIHGRQYEIATPETFEAILADYYTYDGVIAIDTETTGLKITYRSREGKDDQLVGICLSKKPGTGHYFPLQMTKIQNLCDGDHKYFMERYMRKFLTVRQFVTHNLQFDWKVFYIYGINLNVVFDTMVALYVTERTADASFEVGLKSLAARILGLDMFELDDFVKNGDWSKSGMHFSDLPFELCRRYAPTDADMTLSLYYYIKEAKILERYGAEYIANLEVQFAKAASYSEFYGYPVKMDSLPELETTLRAEAAKLYNDMKEIVGHDFNPRSQPQLVKIMYDELKIPPRNGERSTKKEILAELADMTDFNDKPLYPFVAILREYRKVAGIISNFLESKDEYINSDGIIHPSVNTLGARTGRVSIKDPNYQSYNDAVKKNIVPRKGYKMWDCDFSQIEYRTLASMAHEKFLIDAFEDPDTDYHTLQASRMFNVPYAAAVGEIRQQAKRVNFALPYGMEDESLGAAVYGKRCKENTIKAATLRELYFKGQDNVRHFFDVVRGDGVKNGYTTTLFGRKRFYRKGSASVNKIRRQAGNAVIQGCIHGDTRIQTKELGIVKLKDVEGRKLTVWDGERWTKGDIMYSGQKRKCIVRFNGGMTMICSPIHKFLVRSHRGNDRFVECKDLVSSAVSKTPHRVVINQNYVPSDYKYSSEEAYKYKSTANGAHNVFLEDIKDSFSIGVMLGRLASDGSCTTRTNGVAYITQYIAEHEYNIIDTLKTYMQKFEYIERVYDRENRNEQMTRLTVHSTSLAKEICDLDIKHQVHDNIFMDTELLRGFLRGFFDGDGGIAGKVIALTFGTQYDFEPMCRDLQKALLFFGIRSRYRKYENDRYVLSIRTYDNARFLELIGFLNEEKQKKGESLTVARNEHVFGKCLIVESVEITDEYIDMYDVCNTERGYYVADGVVTHNTAADIYKIAVVRVFQMICSKGWLDKVLLDGFIHDEILGEVSEDINFDEFIACWRDAFEVPVEGFCKLFAGFGIGDSWYMAKKQDLHPLFIQELIDTAHTRVWDGDGDRYIKETVVQGFKNHKARRVYEYLQTVGYDEVISPVMSSLLEETTKDWLTLRVTADKESLRSEMATLLQREVTDAQLNAITKKDKKNKPCGISSLQDWILVFCYWQGLDASKIKLRSATDVDTSANADTQAVESNNIEDIAVDVESMSSTEYANCSLQAYGYYVDEDNLTLYVDATYLNEQQLQFFATNFCTVDGTFKLFFVTQPNTAQMQVYTTENKVTGTNIMHIQRFMLQHKSMLAQQTNI